MNYKAVDKWNGDDNLEHRAGHKYYIKVGDGPNARYFYSAEEYRAWNAGGRKEKSNGPKTPGIVNAVNNKINSFKAGVKAKQQAAYRKKLEDKASQIRSQRAEAIRAGEAQSAKNRTNAQKRQAGQQRAQNQALARTSRSDTFRKIKNDKASDPMRRAVASYNHNEALKEQQRRKNPVYRTKADIENAYYTTKYKAGKAVKAAKKAAKKAYNSKQGQAIRTKAKTTANKAYKVGKKKAAVGAKAAYNRGKSFVKKLFGRK